MHNLRPLDLLLEQRKEHWLMHCRFVLERLLIPMCQEGHVKTPTNCQRAVIIIDNRIDKQWLFTVLNTWLMCPKDSEFMLITDERSVAQAKELLDYLRLSHRLTHKPSALSGGEQQRVAVARALINSPSVILADEPSGNLDSVSAERLHKLFFDLL